MRAMTGSDLHRAEICALWGCELFRLGSPVTCAFPFGVRALAVPQTWHSIPLSSDGSSCGVDLCSNTVSGHDVNALLIAEKVCFPKVSELVTFVVKKKRDFRVVVFSFIPICQGQ